jgi:hypothetical protein
MFKEEMGSMRINISLYFKKMLGGSGPGGLLLEPQEKSCCITNYESTHRSVLFLGRGNKPPQI